jgi:hypothetical protein
MAKVVCLGLHYSSFSTCAGYGDVTCPSSFGVEGWCAGYGDVTWPLSFVVEGWISGYGDVTCPSCFGVEVWRVESFGCRVWGVVL